MKIRYAAKISLDSARSIAPSHIHVSLNALVAFDQRVACFHLIPEARLIRGLTRYHRTYFWTLFAYANAVPAAGDPVSEIVKLNRARARERADEKRHASVAAFSIRGRSRARFEIIEAIHFLV